jgi:hypothetical protein
MPKMPLDAFGNSLFVAVLRHVGTKERLRCCHRRRSGQPPTTGSPQFHTGFVVMS